MPDGIYAIGGYNGKDYISTVERFNISQNIWEPICQLSSPKCTMSAICSDDFSKLYVIGGFNGTQLDEIEEYDTVTKKFKKFEPAMN